MQHKNGHYKTNIALLCRLQCLRIVHKFACAVLMMGDEIRTFESSINLSRGNLIGDGQPIEYHEVFGALHPQFWGLDAPRHCCLSLCLSVCL